MSFFDTLLQLNPANPLHTYAIEQAILEIQSYTDICVEDILDSLPAAMGLLSLRTPIHSSVTSHIESCLLVPFRCQHRIKMWYVLNEFQGKVQEYEMD
jgi:hypothetical protein